MAAAFDSCCKFDQLDIHLRGGSMTALLLFGAIVLAILIGIALLAAYFNWSVLHTHDSASAVRFAGAGFGMVLLLSLVPLAIGSCNLFLMLECWMPVVIFEAINGLLGVPLLILSTASVYKCSKGSVRRCMLGLCVLTWIVCAASLYKSLVFISLPEHGSQPQHQLQPFEE